MNTRNLSIFQTLHRFEGLDSKIYDEYPVQCIGLVQMGFMQVIIDILSWHFKEDIVPFIESGYRPPHVNVTVSKGNAKLTSNHIYRLELITEGPHKFKKMIRSASDFVPCYASNLNKVVNMDEAFCLLAPILRGEFYFNRTVYGKDGQGSFHYGQQAATVKVPWVTTWVDKKAGVTKDVPWTTYYNIKPKEHIS